jgi:hypothetical protein
LNRRIVLTIFAFVAMNATSVLRAQTPAAASQQAAVSVFGGATGTWTGLGSGKNIGATVGGDVALHHSSFLVPDLEVRGTWPVYKGHTDNIRDILGGVRFVHAWGRFVPYFDVLYGRGALSYRYGGYPNAAYTYLYKKSPSNMLSVGGGAELPLNYSWSIKADVQWQRYADPVASSDHSNAVPVTIGIVYRFHSP